LTVNFDFSPKIQLVHFTTSTAVIIFICLAGAANATPAFAVAGPRTPNNLPHFTGAGGRAPVLPDRGSLAGLGSLMLSMCKEISVKIFSYYWYNTRQFSSAGTGLHHRLFVIAHFQTISQDLSTQSIIFST